MGIIQVIFKWYTWPFFTFTTFFTQTDLQKKSLRIPTRFSFLWKFSISYQIQSINKNKSGVYSKKIAHVTICLLLGRIVWALTVHCHPRQILSLLEKSSEVHFFLHFVLKAGRKRKILTECWNLKYFHRNNSNLFFRPVVIKVIYLDQDISECAIHYFFIESICVWFHSLYIVCFCVFG